MTRLEGRGCVITGASRGLGAHIARTLWAEGANILLVARSERRLRNVIDELEVRPRQCAYSLVCDLAETEGAGQVAEASHRLLGNVSVLVNNAAIQGPIGSVWETDSADWERTLRINLLSVVALCRSFVPLMAANGGGKIVNVSGGGATGPRPRFAAYATAKAALVRFSETLAQEVQALGIDVNCIAPGDMNSVMTEAVIAAGPVRSGEKEYANACRVSKQGAGTERAAALCAFLASDESKGITGKLVSALWDPWETLADHVEQLAGSDIYTLRRILPKERGLGWGER